MVFMFLPMSLIWITSPLFYRAAGHIASKDAFTSPRFFCLPVCNYTAKGLPLAARRSPTHLHLSASLRALLRKAWQSVPLTRPLVGTAIGRPLDLLTSRRRRFQRGKQQKSRILHHQSAFPFGRLGSPGTIRKVPGGSLDTFSPERKYPYLRSFPRYSVIFRGFPISETT